MPLVTDTKTTAEAAAALGVSLKTVHRMVRDGRLTPMLQGPGRTGPFIFHASEVARAVSVAAQGKAAS